MHDNFDKVTEFRGGHLVKIQTPKAKKLAAP